jgi:hypothetical protein
MATTDRKTLIRTLIHILAATAVLLLAACATTQPQATDVTKQAPADAAEPAEEAEIVDGFEGDGMEIPLNGSSLAAFEASLARVKRHSSETDYSALEGAIEYLLVYEIGLNGNREKLAAQLDGHTGNQVIEMVGWRTPAKEKRKAEKAASDTTVET